MGTNNKITQNMSQRSLPNPGTYLAKLNGKIVVYNTESDALCAAVPVTLIDSEVKWSGKATVLLGKQDGTVQRRSIENLKKIFNGKPDTEGELAFTGENPRDLMYKDKVYTDGVQFEVVGEIEDSLPKEGEEQHKVFKIQWINPIGGSSVMPEPIDLQTFLAKWGSNFKAQFSAANKVVKKKVEKPVEIELEKDQEEEPEATESEAPEEAPEVPAPAPEPPKKVAAKAPPVTANPATSGPPSRKATSAFARTANQQEVWELFVNRNETLETPLTEDELGVKWWETVNKIAPEKNGDLTIQQWGKVADKLEV